MTVASGTLRPDVRSAEAREHGEGSIEVLQRCWEGDRHRRPSMQQVVDSSRWHVPLPPPTAPAAATPTPPAFNLESFLRNEARVEESKVGAYVSALQENAMTEEELLRTATQEDLSAASRRWRAIGSGSSKRWRGGASKVFCECAAVMGCVWIRRNPRCLEGKASRGDSSLRDKYRIPRDRGQELDLNWGIEHFSMATQSRRGRGDLLDYADNN